MAEYILRFPYALLLLYASFVSFTQHTSVLTVTVLWFHLLNTHSSRFPYLTYRFAYIIFWTVTFLFPLIRRLNKRFAYHTQFVVRPYSLLKSVLFGQLLFFPFGFKLLSTTLLTHTVTFYSAITAVRNPCTPFVGSFLFAFDSTWTVAAAPWNLVRYAQLCFI